MLTFTSKEDMVIPQESIDTCLGKENKLLPCPFCGNTFVVITGRVGNNPKNVVLTVSCIGGRHSPISMFTCIEKESINEGMDELTRDWNNRKQ